MKRADLKVGAELYYSGARDWREWDNGEKAIVADATTYANTGYEWRRRFSPDPKGSYVKVTLAPRYGGETYETYVKLAHLRGPWEQCKAEAKKGAAERRALRDAERAAREVALARAMEVAALAERYGLRRVGVGTGVGGGYYLSVDPEALAAFLDALPVLPEAAAS